MMKKGRRIFIMVLCALFATSVIYVVNVQIAKTKNEGVSIRNEENIKKLVARGYPIEVARELFKKFSIYVSDLLNYESNNRIIEYFNQPFFLYDNYSRYLDYESRNPSMSIKEIVNQTNMYLDYPFYGYDHLVLADSITMIVNKYNILPSTYIPKNLKEIPSKIAVRPMDGIDQAVNALIDLTSSIKEETNLELLTTSAYRSFQYQETLYNSYKAADGEEEADKLSARAGYSEHQTGLSFDLLVKGYTLEDFYKTSQYLWVKDNAYRFGFIIRYEKEKTGITGYSAEEWHIRYVGQAVATLLKDSNLSLEEYTMMNSNYLDQWYYKPRR